MSARGTGVRVVTRRGKRRLLIDFTYRDSDGKDQRYRHDASVQTMAAARAEADRLRRLAAETGSPYEATEEVSEPQEPTLTFSQFVDGIWSKLWMTTYAPSTQDRYNALLSQGVRDHFGSLPLDHVSSMAMRAYNAKLAVRGVQIKPHQSFVSSILKAAVAAGVLDEFPKDWPKLPKQKKSSPDSPSDDEVERILAIASGWLRVAVALAVFGSMRSGEVRAFEVRDIDFERNRINIRRTLSGEVVKEKDTKDHEDRSIPIAPKLLPILEEAVKDKLPRARLVLTEEGTTPKRQKMWSRLAALLKRHGMRHHSFHSLRHYFCSALIDRGIPVPVVQHAAGHSDLKTTQRYVHSLRSLDGIWG